MRFDGYVEARKIDAMITKIYADHNHSDLIELREIVRFARTIKTTCKLIERAAITDMEELAQ